MTDIFAGQTPSDDTPALRDELLNKWKDKPAEELLKAKIEADLHIKTLEREKSEMYDMYKSQREELLAKAKFEEYIDQLRAPPVTPVTDTIVKSEQPKPFDPTEIENLFDRKLSAYEAQKRESENFGKVQSKLRERFGDNYATALKDQADSLGLTSEAVNNLIKQSPEAFFRMLGLNDNNRSDFQAPPRNNKRNDSFAPSVVKRDWNYYQNLKKTNPMIYLDPKISAQMERDAQELGSAFGLPE